MLPLCQEEKNSHHQEQALRQLFLWSPHFFYLLSYNSLSFLKLLYWVISGSIATESSFFLWGFPCACKTLCVSPVNLTHITLIHRSTKNLKKGNLKVIHSLWKYLLFNGFLIL
jgi:hypothetical protein